MQKTVGYTGKTYGIGDDITVIDKYAKLTLKQRIIAYKECDDPTQNSITVGVFVRDNASLSVETDRIANEANRTANNSVQQGEKYSNVSITHSDGFKATSKDNTLRVMMNGDDCFVVQVKKNNQWVTVNQLEAFGLLIDRLTSIAAKDKFYIQVGEVESGKYGLNFYFNDSKGCSIFSRTKDDVTISAPHGINITSRETNSLVHLEAPGILFESDEILVHNKANDTLQSGITGHTRIGILKEDGSQVYGYVEFINGIATSFPGI